MWNEIKTDKDIENLMHEYCGFHDSCIVSIQYQSGANVDDEGAMSNGGLLEHTVDMLLHSQCCNPIELRFIGVRKCNIAGWNDYYFCDIFGAYVAFHTDLFGETRDDKLIVWADCEYFEPQEYIEDEIIPQSYKSCTYIVAEKLFWRMAE